MAMFRANAVWSLPVAAVHEAKIANAIGMMFYCIEKAVQEDPANDFACEMADDSVVSFVRQLVSLTRSELDWRV